MTETHEVAEARPGTAPASQLGRAVLAVVTVLAVMGACFAGVFLRGGQGAGGMQLLLAFAGLAGVTGLVCVVIAVAIRLGERTEG